MTQIRLAFRTGPFAYTKIVAKRTGLWNDSEAYMVAHRLEVRAWKFLIFGIEEMSVTAGGPLDWTYVIPLIPIKFAEHQIGDRDNVAIGTDVEIFLARRGRIFGELFVDDFSGFPLNFWGDKLAFTVGGEAVGFPFASSLIQVEYAHVEPWVFTHHLINTQLQHYGSLLGSILPPNSHALHLAWQHTLETPFEVRLEYEFMQRDALSRGGSIFDFHIPAVDGNQKVFLGGVVESRNTITVGSTYWWNRFLELRAKVGYMSVTNWKSQSGSNLASPAVSGEVYLKY